MDVQFKARSLWKTGKEVMVTCTKTLSSGISFAELFSLYAIYIRFIIPSTVEHFIDCLVAYFLFHFYLLYVLIFSFSLSIFKKFKSKGATMVPVSGALQEKAGIYLTYFFVGQSIFKFTMGVPTLDRLMGWAFQVKPQINFKPQIKIGKSKSAESGISLKNKMNTALHVGFESDDEMTRKTMKNLKKVRKNVDFAAEIADAVIGSDDEIFEENTDEDVETDPNTSTMLQKWLEESSEGNEEIKRHVQKLVDENQHMRRRSMAPKHTEDLNLKELDL